MEKPEQLVASPISNVEGRALAAITVSSRIPEFWVDQTRLWFIEFEAVIENQRLSNEAKLNLVITKLSKIAMQQVSDLLIGSADTRTYQALKDRLLEVFEESETRKFQKLMGEMELGDQRPSQLLRSMRDLARDKINDETPIMMWQSHLPTSVRPILTVTDTKNIETLAKVVDKVIENTVVSNSAQILEVKAAPTAENTSAIVGELAKINLRLKELERGRSRERLGGRARYRSSTRGESVVRENNPNWLCIYHFRYRQRAIKCVKPCNWKPEQKSQNSSSSAEN